MDAFCWYNMFLNKKVLLITFSEIEWHTCYEKESHADTH